MPCVLRDNVARESEQSATSSPAWKIVGPGIVVAATGVGAADLVATLVAGATFGYLLLWCVIVGCILKVVLVEGAGRYSLATGNTIFQGWRTLGSWTTWYFAPYIVIWGFVYGSAAMAGTGLALHSLFPWLGVEWWGILCGTVGLLLVWSGHYHRFEAIMTWLVGVMFATMIFAAALASPNLSQIIPGLLPSIPRGALVNVLSLAGGVGGTITLAAYGYWLREKGWHAPKFMRVMRIDNTMAYVITGLFVLATLVVGAELMYSMKIAEGDKGLIMVSDVLAQRYGNWAGKIFLVGFWAAAMTSLIGVWNGVSLMFADFMGNVTGRGSGHRDSLSGGKWYKAYILWLTFPPMAMMFLGKPVFLILAYGVLGAFFMPFLALTLLWILNTDRVPPQWRNKPLSNILMALCLVLFAWLAASEIGSAVGRAFLSP